MFAAYVGYYSLVEMTIRLFEQDGQLLSEFPGMPPGNETGLLTRDRPTAVGIIPPLLLRRPFPMTPLETAVTSF